MGGENIDFSPAPASTSFNYTSPNREGHVLCPGSRESMTSTPVSRFAAVAQCDMC